MSQYNRTAISKKYEFCNAGTYYSFDPKRTMFDNLNGGKKITWLEFHLDLVRERNSPDVYIIDSNGNIVNPDGSFAPVYQPKKKEDARSKDKGNYRRNKR